MYFCLLISGQSGVRNQGEARGRVVRSFGNPHFITPILCEGGKELMREAGDDIVGAQSEIQ